jgi:hypothetical protein
MYGSALRQRRLLVDVRFDSDCHGHTARSATGTGTFAALTDGKAAPINAIVMANKIPIPTRGKVTARLKTLAPRTFCWSLNSSHALDAPIIAPVKDRKSASIMTEAATAIALKPNARSVAISRDRVPTAEYSVLIVPKMAPMAIRPPRMNATVLKKPENFAVIRG